MFYFSYYTRGRDNFLCVSYFQISAVGHNIVQNVMHADKMSILSSNFLSGKVEYLMTDFGNLPNEAEIGFEVIPMMVSFKIQ